jgi:hypothetical protein
MALAVSLVLTVKAPVYLVDEVVGVEPFVVQQIVAPEAPSLIVTV